MLKNYFKVALRGLRRHKGYAFINVAGLAVGLAVCLVIGLFVQHKLSYDRFHPNADRVYRLYQVTEQRGDMAATPPGIAQALESTFPEIEQATVVHQPRRGLLSLGADPFYVDQVISTDESFFKVFPYDLLQGNPDEALAGPGRAVLTASMATQLFGAESPIGRTFTYENRADYEITGVVENPPANAHFQFNVLLSLSEGYREWRYGGNIEWNYFGGITYLLLHEGTAPSTLETKIIDFETASDKPEMLGETQFALMAAPRIHLHSKMSNEIAPQGDVQQLYLFSAIALLILLIACVNYMNLATARSARRAREVGVRKAVGAGRAQLVRQFLSESMLLSVLALPLAMVLADLSLPFVNRLAGLEMTFEYVQQAEMLLLLTGIVLFVGVIAGSYPAFFLSAFRPSAVLTGRGRTSQRGGVFFRKTLVVFQFSATTVLLIGTAVVQVQLGYIQEKHLGFDQEHVVSITSRALAEHYEAFKQTLFEGSHVQAVTSGAPLGIGWKSMSRGMEDRETGERWELDMMTVDYGYLETLGLTVREGRAFSADFPSDPEEAVLLTQAAIEHLYITEDPIGQSVQVMNDESVIGVVEDFHNTSLHDPIRPIALLLEPGFNSVVLVRLTPGDLSDKLAFLEQAWARFVSDRPFEFAFLDDRIHQLYQAEQQLARIFGVFAALAVLVACLGLFGLAAFMTEQRTKEIGIRKVLGANVGNLVLLLSKEFVLLVLIAVVLATPLAYLAMNKWLATFTYHIDLGGSVFVAVSLMALLIALLTVSYQAFKAALTDPVQSLRYE